MAWDETSIPYVAFEAITGFVTILGNSIVFMAIVKTRQLHTVTNVFIGNLAVADILVGLFVAPLAAVSFMGVPRDVYGCIFVNSAILIFTNVSILMLLGVALERFIAIRLPFEYNRLLTIRRALWINVVIWITGFLLGLLPMYGWNIAPDSIDSCGFLAVISLEYMVYFQFMGLVVVPVIIMFVIYLYIFSVIRKHVRQTDTFQQMFAENRRFRNKWNKEVRAAKFFALLIFLFAVFWLPVNILNTISLFCPTCDVPYPLLLAAIVMSHANSSINPILYAASNSRIQDSIKLLLGWKRGPDDSSTADFLSGRANSTVPARRWDLNAPNEVKTNITVIDGDKLQGALKPSRAATCQSPPQRETKHPSRNGVLPELKVLSPTLLMADENCEISYEANKSLSNGSAIEMASGMNGSPSRDRHLPVDQADFNKSSSKYIGGYDKMSNDEQCTSTSHKRNTSMPSLSSKKCSGHVNFAFIGDSTNDEEISTSVSQRNDVTAKSVPTYSHADFHDTPDKDNNENDDCQAGEDPIRVKTVGDENSKVYTKVSRSSELVGKTQSDFETKTFREIPTFLPAINRNLGLFRMESEPTDSQEFNKITLVKSETQDVVADDKGIDGDGCEKVKENVQTKIIHSYFLSQNDKQGGNVTDVEVNASGSLVSEESCQTKL